MSDIDQYETDLKEYEESFTFWKIFGIFCCPPFPSSIANKLAFVKMVPSYDFLEDPETGRLVIKLNSRAEKSLSENQLNGIDCHLIESKKGKRIACVYIRPYSNASITLLVSHGNGVDIGRSVGFMYELGLRLKTNILIYDYSGYGLSSGKSTERNTYYDINAAYELLTNFYNIHPRQIVLYGQSIGSVPTVDLATKVKCAGVVVHSGLASALKIISSKMEILSCIDVFKNASKVSRIPAPTLIIHGKLDEVVSFAHGESLYKQALNPVAPLWLSRAGHNDCESFPQFFWRLTKFLEEDIDSSHILNETFNSSVLTD